MSQFRALAQSQLDSLAHEPGVKGAMLVSRDGLPILTSGRLGDGGMVAAMSATMLGAAEMAIPDPAPLRVCIDAEKMRLLAVPATRDTLLVVLGDLETSADDQMGLATAAGDAIAHATTPTVSAPASAKINWVQEPARKQFSR